MDTCRKMRILPTKLWLCIEATPESKIAFIIVKTGKLYIEVTPASKIAFIIVKTGKLYNIEVTPAS